MKLASMIAKGEISPEELVSGKELVERAELVKKGLEACKKTIKFPLGTSSIDCYSYTDSAGEYQAWAKCLVDGTFVCYSNWGGNHQIGSCNLLNFESVFMAFEEKEFESDLRRFLLQQIKKANC